MTRSRMPATSRSAVDPYFDSGKLNAIQLMLAARLDELLVELGVDLVKSRKMYYGCCPIHGGDNPGALNLYVDGESVPGYWRCNSAKCHETFKRTIIGFVRGVLSHQRHDWTNHNKENSVSWREALDWCCEFLGENIKTIRVDYGEMEKRRFAADVNHFIRRPEQEGQGISRATVREYLEVPASYFVSRGWSPEILDRYDVGFYPHPNRPLSNRVAVPVYDMEHRFAVGFTGRSVFPKCGKCGRWHDAGAACPKKGDHQAWASTSKWHNHKFNKDSYLYNYWFAKRHIMNSRTAVLVEGPGDVWRLEEAGVRCALAMFGVDLSDEQQVMLEMSGAMNLVVLTDMDTAGKGAREDLKKRLQRSFRLHFPLLNSEAKDLGEMSVVQVRSEVAPLIERVMKR